MKAWHSSSHRHLKQNIKQLKLSVVYTPPPLSFGGKMLWEIRGAAGILEKGRSLFPQSVSYPKIISSDSTTTIITQTLLCTHLQRSLGLSVWALQFSEMHPHDQNSYFRSPCPELFVSSRDLSSPRTLAIILEAGRVVLFLLANTVPRHATSTGQKGSNHSSKRRPLHHRQHISPCLRRWPHLASVGDCYNIMKVKRCELCHPRS